MMLSVVGCGDNNVLEPDAGRSSDGGGGTGGTGATTSDASIESDSGSVADSGLRMDGGGSVDSGAKADGGRSDAGGAGDSGLRADSGMSNDAGTFNPCAGALWCDTFESATLGNVPAGAWRGWNVSLTQATTTISSTRATSGQKALRISFNNLTDSAGKLELPTAPYFAATGYRLFGRAMFYGETVPADGSHVRHHLVRIVGKDPSVPTRSSSMEVRFDDNREVYFNHFVNGGGFTLDCAADPGGIAAMPKQRWVCLEWEFDAAGKAGRVWLDGGTNPSKEFINGGTWCGDGNPTQAWNFPSLEQFSIGLQSYDAFPHVVWFDDIAIGAQRLPCPP